MADDNTSKRDNLALGQEKVNETERRIIYLSFAIIIILSLLMNYSQDQMTSLITLFLIIMIAIANIIYFNSKRKSK